ncbi:MAG: hypothetical protein M5R36_12070 [Deltaproteobacteria bacterium]|nr:hypothetical protein [Deltaproteobacteria bacterium]
MQIEKFWRDYPYPWETPWLRPNRPFNVAALLGLAFLFGRRKMLFLFSIFLFVDFSLMAALIFEKNRFREVITPWHLPLVVMGFAAPLQWIVRQRTALRPFARAKS